MFEDGNVSEGRGNVDRVTEPIWFPECKYGGPLRRRPGRVA